jgi:hypothetical protein
MMADAKSVFLLANVALAFAVAGFVWAHQVEVFRSWRLIDAKSFRAVHDAHWRALAVWVVPIGLGLAGSIALIWYHPAGTPAWAIRAAVLCQVVTQVLTLLFWGRWQAQLRVESNGPDSPVLARLVRTHWMRAVLVSAYAAILIVWMMSALRPQA